MDHVLFEPPFLVIFLQSRGQIFNNGHHLLYFNSVNHPLKYSKAFTFSGRTSHAQGTADQSQQRHCEEPVVPK